ncbi:MAG: RNA polymerase sigma factor [Bacteroidota bacterium]
MATIIDLQLALVNRCKRGDSNAQKELYERYVQAMYNVALRITQDVMEAEDVLQEAFLRAFRHLQNFKGDATFGAWLKRIVINTAINHIKQRKTERLHWDQADGAYWDEPQKEESNTPMAEIQQAINDLPEGYRTVFTLYQIEGYDHKEISNILQISEATSKSQFSRAKKKLREKLAIPYQETRIANYS